MINDMLLHFFYKFLNIKGEAMSRKGTFNSFLNLSR